MRLNFSFVNFNKIFEDFDYPKFRHRRQRPNEDKPSVDFSFNIPRARES